MKFTGFLHNIHNVLMHCLQSKNYSSMTISLKHKTCIFFEYYSYHLNVLFTVHLFNCTLYISSTAKKITFILLQWSELLPTINCSGTSYTVNQCKMNQITDICLQTTILSLQELAVWLNRCIKCFNPNKGGGGLGPPPLQVFVRHFQTVRVNELPFGDF